MELERLGCRRDGLRVLDFGCGTGLLSELLIGRADRIGADEILAVDTSPEMLAQLDRKIAHHGWTTISTSSQLPDGAPFDLIVCSSVLGFVDDLDATVEQLAGLLAPDGVFVQWDWERVGDYDDHGLTRREITSALERAGLEDVAVRTAFEIEVDDLTMSPLVASARRPRSPSA